jgi:hypothetical protein
MCVFSYTIYVRAHTAERVCVHLYVLAIFHCGGGEKTILCLCFACGASERSRRHTELSLLPLSLNLISRPPKLAARDEKIIFSEQLNSVSINTKPKCHGLRAES